jgi:hypothetical protein
MGKEAMNRNPPNHPVAPQRVNEATGLARALGILLNTAQAYETSHAVFQRSLEERMPVFEIALRGLHDMTFYFSNGQVRYGTMPIEPGLRMFQDLAQRFEKAGVQGLVFLPGVTANEVKALINLLTRNAEEISHRGLQVLLEREGVRNIRDCKAKIGLVENGKEKASDPSRKSAKGASSGAWELEMESELPEPVVEPMPEASDDPPTRAFRGFVQQTLSTLSFDQEAVADVANDISSKFKEILTEQVEIVRQEGEKKVRRLNTIKDVVLRELELHHLAALVCDNNLFVLSTNQLGRDLIGDAQRLEKGSPLEQFIASGLERQVIEMDGVPRVAHVILSAEPVSNDKVLLISIE